MSSQSVIGLSANRINITEPGYEMGIEFRRVGSREFVAVCFDRSGEVTELMTAEDLKRRSGYFEKPKFENDRESTLGSPENLELMRRTSEIVGGLTLAADILDRLNDSYQPS